MRFLVTVNCIFAMSFCSPAGAKDVSTDSKSVSEPPLIVYVRPPQEAERPSLDQWLRQSSADAVQSTQLIQQARGGDPQAQWLLGVKIDSGEIGGGTLEEAVALFEAAASQGLANAVVSLGIMRAKGRGTTQDYVAARSAFEQAARMGSVSALYQIGVMEYQGHGTPPDHQESLAWFMSAASLEDEWAQRSLGNGFTDDRLDWEAARQRSSEILHDYRKLEPASTE